MDPEDSDAKWRVRVYFYDGQGAYLGREDVALGQPGSLSTDWRQVGGRFTAPEDAASLRIQLFNYLNSGWVAFDDLALAQVIKYYFLDNRRVAMRKEGTLHYLVGDHPSATPGQVWAPPTWCSMRTATRRPRRAATPTAGSVGTIPTDYRFTERHRVSDGRTLATPLARKATVRTSRSAQTWPILLPQGRCGLEGAAGVLAQIQYAGRAREPV